jgi:cytochrome oxidase assembly protein ShyY1
MYTLRSLEVKQCEPETDHTPQRLCRGIVSVMFCPHLWLSTCEKQRAPTEVGLFERGREFAVIPRIHITTRHLFVSPATTWFILATSVIIIIIIVMNKILVYLQRF